MICSANFYYIPPSCIKKTCWLTFTKLMICGSQLAVWKTLKSAFIWLQRPHSVSFWRAGMILKRWIFFGWGRGRAARCNWLLRFRRLYHVAYLTCVFWSTVILIFNIWKLSDHLIDEILCMLVCFSFLYPLLCLRNVRGLVPLSCFIATT